MIIYCIKNKINGKCYIGQTTGNLTHRVLRHSKESGCIGINRAINKYGLENFDITIISKASNIDELNELEIKSIKDYNSIVPNGYNLTSGGCGAGKMLEQTKQKIRSKLIGNKNSLGHKGPKILGVDNHSSKLKETEVIEIKSKLNKYIGKLPYGTLARLGREYNVHYMTISDIYLGITWKHVLIENEI